MAQSSVDSKVVCISEEEMTGCYGRPGIEDLNEGRISDGLWSGY